MILTVKGWLLVAFMALINHARKTQAFKPGDEWHPRAKRRPFIFMA
jgi:hypothetical protein